jgi:hypothetical protein
VVILAAIITPIAARQTQTLSHLGDFLSGFAAALAFIWLIAAYRLQAQELRLQRSELALQREAIQQQREELRKMGKYAALEQASRILRQFDELLANNPEDRPRSVSDLSLAYMNGMTTQSTTILESPHTREVITAYTGWAYVDNACEEFLNRVVSAVELYEEATGSKILPDGDSSVERIYLSTDTILHIPFIRQYIGVAKSIATQLFITQPGRDRLQLRGLEVLNSASPGAVKEAALATLRARVAAYDEKATK